MWPVMLHILFYKWLQKLKLFLLSMSAFSTLICAVNDYLLKKILGENHKGLLVD